MSEIKNKVYIRLDYTVNKKNFSIYREDAFFFPAFTKEEHDSIIEYIKSIMQTRKNVHLYLQRIENNGRLHKGFLPVSDYINIKIYKGNGKGVVTILDWSIKKEAYNDNEENVTIKEFAKCLQEEIKLQENWIK